MAAKQTNDEAAAGTQLVRSQSFQGDVSSILRSTLGAKSPAVATPDVLADYRENEVLLVKDEKEFSRQVEALEREAIAIGSIWKNVSGGFLQIGKLLMDAQVRIGHGGWEFYVKHRIGMSMDTAQRFQAAARGVTEYPVLAPVASNIPNTLLAAIGSARDMNQDKAERIAQAIEAGDVDNERGTSDLIMDILREGREPRTKPLPYDRVSRQEAEAAITTLRRYMAGCRQALKDIKVPEDSSHAELTRYVQKIMQTGSKKNAADKSDFHKELRATIVLAWVMEDSYRNGPAVPAPRDVTPEPEEVREQREHMDELFPPEDEPEHGIHYEGVNAMKIGEDQDSAPDA